MAIANERETRNVDLKREGAAGEGKLVNSPTMLSPTLVEEKKKARTRELETTPILFDPREQFRNNCEIRNLPRLLYNFCAFSQRVHSCLCCEFWSIMRTRQWPSVWPRLCHVSKEKGRRPQKRGREIYKSVRMCASVCQNVTAIDFDSVDLSSMIF